MSIGVRPLTNSNLQKALVGLENGPSVAAESGEGLMATNSSRRLGAKMSAAAPVRRARPSEKLRSPSALTADLPSLGGEPRDGLADRDRDGIAARYAARMGLDKEADTGGEIGCPIVFRFLEHRGKVFCTTQVDRLQR